MDVVSSPTHGAFSFIFQQPMDSTIDHVCNNENAPSLVHDLSHDEPSLISHTPTRRFLEPSNSPTNDNNQDIQVAANIRDTYVNPNFTNDELGLTHSPAKGALDSCGSPPNDNTQNNRADNTDVQIVSSPKSSQLGSSSMDTPQTTL